MMLIVILLLLGSTLLLLAVRSLRAQRLKERYALVMVLTGLPFVLLAVWPDAVGQISELLGIQYTTVLILVITTFFLLAIFKLLSIVSVQDRKITTLAQQVGILTEQLRLNDPAAASSDMPTQSSPHSDDESCD